MIIVGIDPGTGTKSALGFCILDSDVNRILLAGEIWPDKKSAPAYKRIRSICAQLRTVLIPASKKGGLLVTESFVMRGKGGETLQRLTGAVHVTAGEKFDVAEVSNMKLKQILSETGTGDAAKEDLAYGIQRWFATKGRVDEARMLEQFIEDRKFDATDAIALAVAGSLG